VGQRIAAQSDRNNIPYKYLVVDQATINAFATTGGFIYVHTGLLKSIENEAQLASVLAYEAGHISARHIVKDM
jgi:beta-barrel assembly-enhancing protease